MLSGNNKYFFSLQSWLLIVVLAACFCSYLQVTHYEFLQWDDDAQITKNAYVKNLNWQSIQHNLEREKFTALTLTVYSVVYKIWGNNPAPFHWMSLLLHLLNIILIFQLTRQFSKNVFTTSFVLLLFALHPTRVESVAWISEMKDLLFTFFSLSGFLFYFKYVKSNFKFYFFIFASLMALLASFSKIQGLLVPFSFFLIDIFLKRRISLKSILEKVFLILIMLDVLLLIDLRISGIICAMLIIGFLIDKKTLIQDFFSDVFKKNTLPKKVILKILLIVLSFFLVFFIFSLFKLRIVGILIALMMIYLLTEKLIFRDRTFAVRKPVKISLVLFFGLAGLFFIAYSASAFQLSIWHNNPESSNSFSFAERFLLAGYALWFYIKNLVIPFPLNAVHPYPVRLLNGEFPAGYYVTLIVLLLTIIFSVFLVVRRKKIPELFFFGWFFFLVNISMVLHFIPIEGRIVVADRYTYLSYFGLFVAVAAVGEHYFFQKQKLRIILLVCFAVLLGALSYSTYSRCKVWRNTKVLFTDVLQKNPQIPFAYCNLAASYMYNQRADSAILCFDKALKMDPLDPTAYFNRAFSFIEIKNENNALKDFNSSVMLTKNNKLKALAYAHMGEIYDKRREDSLSIHYFNLAINTDSFSSYAFNKRGAYFLNRNKIDNAFADFKKAVGLDIYYAEAFNNLGSVQMAKGNIMEARKYFNRAIELESDYTLAYANRGYAKYNSGDAAGAIKDYNSAIKLNPALYPAYINRGRAYAQLRDYKSAINDFSYVLSKDSNNMIALTNRAYARFYNNEMAAAESDFLLNTKLYQENASVWQNIAWFHSQLKKYKSAISEYERSIDCDSSIINSYINLGLIYIETKEFKNAETYLLHALKINPDSPEALFLLGELNRKNGNAGAACEYYQKASDRGYAEAKKALNSFCKNSAQIGVKQY